MHGTGDNLTATIRNVGFKGTATQEHDGCDHTSTNAPDPIRTPQLSVLGKISDECLKHSWHTRVRLMILA